MAIEDVLSRHEAELMALPGVVGVGLARRASRAVILVMLDRPPAALPSPLPDRIEGFPVEVEVVGEISAL